MVTLLSDIVNSDEHQSHSKSSTSYLNWLPAYCKALDRDNVSYTQAAGSQSRPFALKTLLCSISNRTPPQVGESAGAVRHSHPEPALQPMLQNPMQTNSLQPIHRLCIILFPHQLPTSAQGLSRSSLDMWLGIHMCVQKAICNL